MKTDDSQSVGGCSLCDSLMNLEKDSKSFRIDVEGGEVGSTVSATGSSAEERGRELFTGA